MKFRKFLMFASRGTAPSFTIEVKSDNSGTSGTDQFTIPTTTGTYLYDYTTSDGQSGTGITGDTTITFASGAGTYEIYITGTFPKIYFNNVGDKDKLLRVLEWGDYGVGETDQARTFYGCTNLTSIANDVDNINLVVNGQWMFRFCPLTALPSGITFPDLSVADQIFSSSTFPTARYSQLLVDLESGNANNSVVFRGGNSKYNATGETARDILTGPVRLWRITDGGLEI